MHAKDAGAASGNWGWIKMKQNQPRSAQMDTSKILRGPQFGMALSTESYFPRAARTVQTEGARQV